MGVIADIISLGLQVCIWIILIQVAVSWLIVFNVISTRNLKAKNLVDLLEKVTAPVYTPLRKHIPPIGGIDIVPLVVILGLSVIQSIIS